MEETLRKHRTRVVSRIDYAEDVLKVLESLEKTKAKVKIIECKRLDSRHLDNIELIDESRGERISIRAEKVINSVPRLPRVSISRCIEVKKIQVPLLHSCSPVSFTHRMLYIQRIEFPIIRSNIKIITKPLNIIRIPRIFTSITRVSMYMGIFLNEQKLRYIPSYGYVEVRTSIDLLPIRMPTIRKCSVIVTDKARKEVRVLLRYKTFEESSLLCLIGGKEFEEFMTNVAQGKVGEPVFIIVRKNMGKLWYLLWIICREIYRELRGELPEGINFVNMPKDSFINWLKYRGRFAGRILVLSDEITKLHEDELSLLAKRIQEAYTQSLGFIILLSNDPALDEEKIRELAKPYIPKVFVLDIDDLERRSRAIHEFLASVFGLGKEFFEKPPDIDEDVAICDRMYRDFIRSLLSDVHSLIHARRDIAEESEDHLALKILAWKYLRYELGIPIDRISMTKELKGVVADVYAELEDGKKIVVEVETLFGVGPAPLLKIIDSIRKYLENDKEIDLYELWIVIPNWVMTLYMPKLIYIKDIYSEELRKRGVDLRILVPNILLKTLKDIEYIKETINNVKNVVDNDPEN